MSGVRCVCPFCGQEPRKGERHNCRPLQEIRNVSSPVETLRPTNQAAKKNVTSKSAASVLDDFLALMQSNRSLQRTPNALSKCGGADFLVSFLLAVAPGCVWPTKDPKRALVAAVTALRDSACRTLQRGWRQRKSRYSHVRPGTAPKTAFQPSPEPTVPALVQVTPEMKQALGGSGWANDLFQEFLGGLGKTDADLVIQANQAPPTITKSQNTTVSPSTTSPGTQASSISPFSEHLVEAPVPQAPSAPRSAQNSVRPNRRSSRSNSSTPQTPLEPSPDDACENANVSGTMHNETSYAIVSSKILAQHDLESRWDDLDGHGCLEESICGNLVNEYGEEMQPALTPLERRALREQAAVQSHKPELPPPVPSSPSMGRALPEAAATNRLNERLQRRKDGADRRWRAELGTRDPSSVEVPLSGDLGHAPVATTCSGSARKDALARLQNKQAQRQQDVVLLEV